MRGGGILGTLVLGILIIIMVGAVAAFLLGDIMPGAETWPSDMGPRVVSLLALGIVIGGAMIASPPALPAVVRSVFSWLLIGVVLVGGYAYRHELEGVGRRIVGTLMPGYAITDPVSGTITVMRDRSNHYRIQGAVNGAPVEFLFDTGASALTLRNEDASAAGIDTGRLSYTIPVSTANGRSQVAAIRVNDLSIDSLRLDNIRAFVARPGALETSLLGMSVMDRLKSWRVEGDRLILEP